MFPIINQRGFVVGFGGRVIDAGEPKYLNSPETPLFEKGRELYGLPQARQAIRDAGRVLVVEGYMDVVALAQHGVGYAVATLGTATTPVHVQKLLRQADEIVFSFDGDAAGRKAAWHALEVSLPATLDNKTIRFLFLPEGEDPDSYVRAQGKAAFEELAGRAEPLSAYLLAQLRARVDTNTAEGRSRLVHDAKPLLKSVAAPGLQLQLLKQVADITGMSQQEVERLCELHRSAPAPGAWQRPAPPKVGSAAVKSFELRLLEWVLLKPALASELSEEIVRGESLEARALLALAEYARGNPDASSEVMLIDHFRGSPFETLLKQVRSELMVLALSPEQAEGAFREALPGLERRRIHEQLNELQRKNKAGALSPADIELMNALTKRLGTLDQRPGANRPVV
jgi:DNA primase